MVITDLGCASGPNTLTLVETAVEAIFRHCMDKEELPEISVFLNDLPDNDSNNVAKILNTFQQSTQQCFSPVVAAILQKTLHKCLMI